MLHSVRTFEFHFLRDMPVHIQSECCSCMTQIFLYGFDVVTGSDRGYCKGVAQIVKAGIGSTNFCDDLFEFQIDGLMFQVMTQLISKHKTGILPGRTI